MGALVQAGNLKGTRQTVLMCPLSPRNMPVMAAWQGLQQQTPALAGCWMRTTTGAGTAAYAASCSWRSRSRAAAAALRAVRRRSCSRLMTRAGKLSGGPGDMPLTPRKRHVAVSGGPVSGRHCHASVCAAGHARSPDSLQALPLARAV